MYKIQFRVTNTTQCEKKSVAGNRCAKDAAVKANLYLAVYVGKNKVTVCHIGEHTFPLTSIQKKKDIKTVEQLVRDNLPLFFPTFSEKWTGTRLRKKPLLAWTKTYF